MIAARLTERTFEGRDTQGPTKKVGPGTASTVLFRGLATPDKDVTDE